MALQSPVFSSILLFMIFENLHLNFIGLTSCIKNGKEECGKKFLNEKDIEAASLCEIKMNGRRPLDESSH